MPKKRADIRERLERFETACDAPGSAALQVVRQALYDGHYLLVARAAEVCGERLLFDLEPELLATFERFRLLPAKKDPQCTAKGAIARALVALDSRGARFFIAGLRLRQLEPVWGGTVDTAVDLRTTCAMGLVATAYPRTLIELVGLLGDPEPRARIGAVRAIACAEPSAAEAVLRTKALAGDREPEVVGECLGALLQVAPEESVEFVAGFLDASDPALRELAALALGVSRVEAALSVLRARWQDEPLKREEHRALLRGAILHRSEAAFTWLLDLIADGDLRIALWLVNELAVYRANVRLAARLGEIVAARGDETLTASYRRAWGERSG